MVACSPYHWLIAVHLIISSSTHAQPSGSSPRTEGEGLCPSSIAGDLVSCDSQTGDWLVRNTNWFGVIDNTLVVVNCPPNYCFYSTSSPYVRIPQNISSDPAEVLCYPEVGGATYAANVCRDGHRPSTPIRWCASGARTTPGAGCTTCWPSTSPSSPSSCAS